MTDYEANWSSRKLHSAAKTLLNFSQAPSTVTRAYGTRCTPSDHTPLRRGSEMSSHVQQILF
jgi:hypothetical protein